MKIKNVDYQSTGDSENAVRVKGEEVVITNASINKTAGETSSEENSNFYGLNGSLFLRKQNKY